MPPTVTPFITYLPHSKGLRYLQPMEIIHFTEKAIAAIHTYRKNLMIPEHYRLRVGIRQKNETNKRLFIGFDEAGDKDKTMEVQGIQVIYHPGEVFFFAGMQIDYLENEHKKGFTFVERKKS